MRNNNAVEAGQIITDICAFGHTRKWIVNEMRVGASTINHAHSSGLGHDNMQRLFDLQQRVHQDVAEKVTVVALCSRKGVQITKRLCDDVAVAAARIAFFTWQPNLAYPPEHRPGLPEGVKAARVIFGDSEAIVYDKDLDEDAQRNAILHEVRHQELECDDDDDDDELPNPTFFSR